MGRKIWCGHSVMAYQMASTIRLFQYPRAIRKPIYTTNAVEAVHRQFRKLTKTKGAFPNEDSLMKLLYICIQQASEKWTMPIQEWGGKRLLNYPFTLKVD